VTRRRTLTTAIVAALVLGVAACGGGDTSGAADETADEAAEGAAAVATDEAADEAADDAADETADVAAGKIGVILPDSVSSTRWETADRPELEEAFEAAGVEYDIQNAEGDPQRMATIAEQMILDGVTVLAIVNLDSDSGALIQRHAAQRGVRTIDYDRLTLGGSAEYYVSFDAKQVGRLQGRGLALCLGQGSDARIAFLNGSPDDHNATLFAEGAHEVLDRRSNYTQVAEQPVPDWDVQRATTIFEQMLLQAGDDIQGVLAANDALADAVLSVLDRNDVDGKVHVTGQDATLEGLRNILAGDQCRTVYKPIAEEADALAELAIALLDGEEGETDTVVVDRKGHRQVPAILLRPISIRRENVARVVDDGFVTADDLCAGELARECRKLGID
jgi:D-xylose transport system substrate-binding protein